MKVPGQMLVSLLRQGLRNPSTRQWVIVGVLLYLISPIDLIPSFLPGVGEIDDVILLGVVLSQAVQLWLESNWGGQPAPSSFDTTSPPRSSGRSPADRADAAVVDVEAVTLSEEER